MTSQIEARASVFVIAGLAQSWSVLLSPLSYRTIDTRLTDLAVLGRTGRQFRLRVHGYFVFTLLESSTELELTLRAPRSLEYRAERESFSLPGRLAIDYLEGEIVLEAIGNGTLVRQRETYVLTGGVIGRLVARHGKSWLQRHFDEIQMPRLKQVIERAAAKAVEVDDPLSRSAPGGSTSQ